MELIKIQTSQIGAENINSTNARDIHTYLEVNTPFPTWIKRAVERYDFVEDEDYVSFITDSKSGKRDFVVSMDMAKELCMLENNLIGK
ncbi:MAG: antA/AntB antirepressor family protein, partial [Sulfurimonas sp.]|nr:antA/AntB antirepressor family protein [Sulfurimonas sp.]